MVKRSEMAFSDPDEERNAFARLLHTKLTEQSGNTVADIEEEMGRFLEANPDDAVRIKRIFEQASAYARLMPTALTASFLEDTEAPAEEAAEEEPMIIEGKAVEITDEEESDDA